LRCAARNTPGSNASNAHACVRTQQVEKQFNTLLDACGAFRQDIGGAADVVSLGRAMEQLSSGAANLQACFV
jgi:hypothetical protein